MDNAIVRISYSENAISQPKNIPAIVCTDVFLTTKKLLDAYMEQRPVVLFSHQ